MTKPENVIFRFCGYCGCRFLISEEVFMNHVHLCELLPKETVQ